MSLQRKESIEHLKSSPIPKSPRKSNNVLTCAVLSKSPVRPTRSGSMFTLNLCDNQPGSHIRAVCFTESMFSSFNANETYDISEFKVKKAFGNNSECGVELLIDSTTKVSNSAMTIAMEQHTVDISQILRNETGNLKFINVKAKVVAVDDVLVVGNYADTKSKRSVHVADATGHIELVLWRDRAEKFNYKQDDVLLIQGAVLSTFNGITMLTTVYETVIKKIDEEITIATPKRSHSMSSVMSIQTAIISIKEFTCTFSCIACSKSINPCYCEGDELIECPRCAAQFLKDQATLVCNCQVLLGNKQWFKASTAVINHLFDWSSPKSKPSKEEVVNLLKKKFMLRVDTLRKIVEHAAVVNIEEVNDDIDADVLAMICDEAEDNNIESKKQKTE